MERLMKKARIDLRRDTVRVGMAPQDKMELKQYLALISGGNC